MDAAVLAARQALWVMLQLGGPPLLALLAVGLAVAILQALTQINEATLAFLPKVAVLGGVLLLLSPFMTGVLQAYAETLFELMIVAGGKP